MALVLAGLFLYCRFTFGNSPLQSTTRPPTSDRALREQSERAARQLPDAHGGARGIPPRLATNADVTDGTTPQPGGKAIRSRSRSLLAPRLYGPLPRTGAEIYRRVLERLSQECGLR